MVDIFTLEMGEPLVPLGVFGELVVTVTGSPLVPSEISTVLVTMVIVGSLVPSEVSRELLVMMTEGPMVPLEASRDPVALVPPVTLRCPEADIVGPVGLLVLVDISWVINDFVLRGSWEIVDPGTLLAVEVSGKDTSLAVWRGVAT